MKTNIKLIILWVLMLVAVWIFYKVIDPIFWAMSLTAFIVLFICVDIADIKKEIDKKKADDKKEESK